MRARIGTLGLTRFGRIYKVKIDDIKTLGDGESETLAMGPNRKRDTELIPLAVGDELPAGVEDDLFNMTTGEFERHYQVRGSSSAETLIPSISAYDLPKMTPESIDRIAGAAKIVSSPANLTRAEKISFEYDTGQRRAPVDEMRRVTAALNSLGTLAASGRGLSASGRETAERETEAALKAL